MFAPNPSDDAILGIKFDGGGIILTDPDAEHPPCITATPTLAPTTQPSTTAPTESGETFAPTDTPTTPVPTPMPTAAPTDTPATNGPTSAPTVAPATTTPTRSGETFSPSPDPLTGSPSTPPTTNPSQLPTSPPSQQPTLTPTGVVGVDAGASGAADGSGSGSGVDASSSAGIVVALLVVIVILAIVVVKRQRRQPRGAEGADKDEEAVAATELDHISAGIVVPVTIAATSDTPQSSRPRSTAPGGDDSGKPLGGKNDYLASAPEVSDFTLVSSSAPAVNDYALTSSTAPIVSDYALASSTAPADHLCATTDDLNAPLSSSPSLTLDDDGHTYETTDDLNAPLSKVPSLTLDDDDHLRFKSVHRSNPLARGIPAARSSIERRMTFREDDGMLDGAGGDALPPPIRRRSTSYGSAVASREAANDVVPLGTEGEVAPMSLEPDNVDGPMDAGYVHHGGGKDIPPVNEDAEWNDINQFLGAVGDDADDTDPKQELQRRASKVSLV